MKIILTAILVMLIFTACNGNGEEGLDAAEFTTPQDNPTAAPTLDAAGTEHAAQMVRDNVIVATLNDIPISAGDVTFIMWEAWNTIQPLYELMDTEAFNRAVLEEAVRLAAIPVLFRDFAERHGIQSDPMETAMVEMEIAEIIEWHGEDEFVEMLAHDGIYGIAHLTDLLHMFSLMDTVMTAIVNDPALFAQFEGYYEAPTEDEELLGAVHILITLDNFESEDEAMDFANEIHARAVAGEDFSALIATYGEDPGMAANPDGYTFVSGVMVQEFEDATRALTMGEISEPVPAFHGIHIIKRVEPNPDDVMRPWGAPSPEQLKMQAIYMAFEAIANEGEIVFLPELYEIPVVSN